MYTFHSKVRYSEVDSKGVLTPYSVINYFQDCSTFQSEELGVGVEALRQNHHAWLLHSWQVVFAKESTGSFLPSLCDEIDVSTWAYDFKGFYGYRNFLMQNQKGDALAYANSIWVYVDTLTGHPSKCPEEVIRTYPIEPAYPMEHAPRKIALPESSVSLPSFPVLPSDIDSNQHVNNASYIRMATDCLPADVTFRQMRVEYRRAAVLGDTIAPSLSRTEDGNTVVLFGTDGKPYVVVAFT